MGGWAGLSGGTAERSSAAVAELTPRTELTIMRRQMGLGHSLSRWIATGLGCCVLFAPTPARASCIEDGGCEGMPCDTSTDCGNDFLVCVPTHVEVCAYPCDASTPTVLNLCQVRYQLPCQIDSDCGAGFTCAEDAEAVCSLVTGSCMHYSRCRSQYTLCTSDGNCPKGWSCYSPGPAYCGPNGCDPDAGPPKACYPPFAEFAGGAGSSPPETVPTDAGATPVDAVAESVSSPSNDSGATPSDVVGQSEQKAEASQADIDAENPSTQVGSNSRSTAVGCACAMPATPVDPPDVSVTMFIGLTLVRRRRRTSPLARVMLRSSPS
jgi:hypothetical protein